MRSCRNRTSKPEIELELHEEHEGEYLDENHGLELDLGGFSRSTVESSYILSLTTLFASPPVGRHKMSQKVTHGRPKVFKSRSAAWPSQAVIGAPVVDQVHASIASGGCVSQDHGGGLCLN